MNMNPEIVTGIFTILGILMGGIITILGILIEHYLHEKGERKLLFRALFDEIQLNILVAQETQKNLHELKVNTTLRERPRNFLYAPLYTQSYAKIRSSGYLVTLNRELRLKIEKAFEKIYSYDRDGEFRWWHTDSLKGLIEELKHLKEELPKHLKFLN